MVKEGLSVYICTSPILTSLYCAQEKVYILYYMRLHNLILYYIIYTNSFVNSVILYSDIYYIYIYVYR